MRKVALRIITGIGILLGVLSIVPFFIDVNNYKPEIEKKLTETLGRPLSIGNLGVHFLPSPFIRIENIKVENIKGSNKPFMASIESAKVVVDILPLLKGHLRLSHISIINPSVALEKVEGKANWDFALPSSGAPSPSAPDSYASHSAVSMAIDHIEVIKGDISYQVEDSLYSLNNLTAKVQLEGLQGPLQANGYVKIQGRDLNFDIYVKDFSDEIPLKASFDMVGTEGSLDGKLYLKTKTFKGDVEGRTHGDALAEWVDKGSYAYSFLKEPLMVRTHMTASAEEIGLQNLEIEADGQKISGLAQLTFKPFQVSLDLRGFAGGTSLSTEMTPAGQASHGTITLDSSNPKKFLTWLKIPTDAISDDLSSPLKFTTDISFRKNLLSLNNLNLSYRQATLGGYIKVNPQSREASYDVSLNGVGPLLKAFGITLQTETGALTLKGNSALKEELITHTSLAMKGAVVRMDGSMGSMTNLAPQVKITMDAPDLSPLFKALTGGSTPVKSVHLSTELTGNLKALSFKKIEGSIGIGAGTIPLKGELQAQLEKIPFLKGYLSVGMLKSDLLVSHASSPSSKYPHPQIILAVARSTSQPAAKNDAVWSTEPFDLEGLKTLNADVDLKIQKFSFKEWLITDLQGKVKLENGHFSLLDVTGNCFQGLFNLEATLRNESTPSFKMIASLKDAELKNLHVQPEGRYKLVGGKLNLGLNLSTKGHSPYEWVSQLRGRLSIEGHDGVLQGFNLRELSDKLKKMNNLTAVLDLLSAAFSKGQTKFGKLTGECEIEKGIGEIKNFLLEADGGQGTATGRIHLPAFKLDLQAAFKLTDHPQLPSIGMHLYGPLNDPQADLDTKAVRDYMVENVFKGLIDKVNVAKPLGGIVEGLMGGKRGRSEKGKEGPSSSSEADQNPENTVEDLAKKPQKVLKSLLNGLF